jgi:uncharacterized protein (DUF2249 family)
MTVIDVRTMPPRTSVVEARPILEAGGEPFPTIMNAVDALEPHECLVVLAPFEPVALEGMLACQGFSHEARELDDGAWRVTFRRPDSPSPR